IAAPLAALFFMPHPSWIWATLLIAMLVLFRHKSNIVKLLEGRESKIGGSR
ncbi:TPA: glycerol-3-phosphate acyltransferase, partial [Neisseria meningitidis]